MRCRKSNIKRYLAIVLLCILANTTRAQDRQWYIPDGAVMQYAGNIGTLSAGPYWSYGKHDRWETHVLGGFVKGRNDVNTSATFTLKETFSPIQWLYASASCNLISGSQYWLHEPDKYNHGDYYRFSSRARFGIGIGGKVRVTPQQIGCRWMKETKIYGEFNTYDLAVRFAICNKSINLFDILSLGLGIQVRF